MYFMSCLTDFNVCIPYSCMDESTEYAFPQWAVELQLSRLAEASRASMICYQILAFEACYVCLFNRDEKKTSFCYTKYYMGKDADVIRHFTFQLILIRVEKERISSIDFVLKWGNFA